MTNFKKVGEIDSIAEIPFDKPIIVSGGIDKGKCWMQQMPGIFIKKDGKIFFKNEYEMNTEIVEDIHLNILEVDG